jgi:hypothetical protein
MNLGICLIGASYSHVNLYGRDWNLSKDNLKTNLVDCFKTEDNVNVYTATYDNTQIQQIHDFYQPKKSLVLPFEGSLQKSTYLKCMQMLLDEDLDFIVTTRFDIFFQQPLSNVNIDRNKMNFVFREIEPHWSQDRFVGDCIFAFPKNYLEHFIYCIEDMLRQDEQWPNGWRMHGGIYNNMARKFGEENINFMLEGNFNSNGSKENGLYKLIRSEMKEEWNATK